MVPRSCEPALQSAACELKYEASTHLVDMIVKDEELRRLNFNMHILQDDNDELRELLTQEENRSDAFEKLVNETLGRAEVAEARVQEVEDDLRQTQQEVGTLQAEARALQTTAADSEAFLTEKLALTRELSNLRPELAHLKAQAASSETLMTEKLELQRQMTTLQCELENARRDAKRALAKRRNTGIEIARDQELEDLKRDLAREQRARRRAEEAADVTQSDVGIDDVRKELAREKRARQKAEDELEAVRENTQVEDVRRDLLREKKAAQKLRLEIEDLNAELQREKKAASRAAKRADGNAEADEQAEDLRQELATEKREKARIEKAAQKAAQEFEAQKATLEEKLDQFRTKLRSTKEKLKDAEAELAAANMAAAPVLNKSVRAEPAAVNSRKRNAAQLALDAADLGTPGDGPAAKRNRKITAAVGDKSTFSLTPFLNKTASFLPASPESDAHDDEQEDAATATPVLAKARENPKQPLAEVSASETNIQKKAPRQRKTKPTPALDIVTEESEVAPVRGKENAGVVQNHTTKVKAKTFDGPDQPADAAKPAKRKIRKSLVDFATFTAEPEPEKKKKRKLGGLGKTLFDEEDDNAGPIKPLPGRGLFGGRGLGTLGLGGKKAGGLLGANKLGSNLLTATDGSGFQFSPLKRSRKNLDDTLRG